MQLQINDTKQGQNRLSWGAYQFTLPLSVLISPLWPKTRMGCARSQLGNVFVENRECT
jgi:hypothetical protein